MIADLHCDLLLYLEKGRARTAQDAAVRCSIPQMRSSGVTLQVLPIFTETGTGSVHLGQRQNQIFHSLPIQYSEHYHIVNDKDAIDTNTHKIGILRSIENASAFCGEEEPLDTGFKRLKSWLTEGKIAYISLTWNTENRFGGGNHTSIGLKEDGKALLNFVSGQKIAIDLSHTSDALAYDILDHIDRNQLAIPIIASHSNCRAIMDVPRNLPDPLMKEIIRREGLIGLNFIKPFLGPSNPLYFSRHLEHLLSHDAHRNVCFGADFFHEEDIPLTIRRPPGEYFFDDYGSSATYPHVCKQWKEEIGVSTDLLEDICHRNAIRFLSNNIF